MKNTITKEAINRLESKIISYNHHAKRAANGKATQEEKDYMDVTYGEFVEMIGLLTDLGYKVEDEYLIIERYESIITQLKIDGETVWKI